MNDQIRAELYRIDKVIRTNAEKITADQLQAERDDPATSLRLRNLLGPDCEINLDNVKALWVILSLGEEDIINPKFYGPAEWRAVNAGDYVLPYLAKTMQPDELKLLRFKYPIKLLSDWLEELK